MSSQQICLTSDAVFKEAAASFQAGLSESAKALFTPVNTIEDLQTFLGQYTQKKGDVWERTWLVRGCEAIQTFSRIMKPYFDVVDTLVSSHPEYAAFLWGGLKLVVQLGSQYSGFFEKIANKYEEIAIHLPRYARQIDLIRKRAEISSFRPSHERLLKSLAYVYTDILQFSCDACQMFTSKSSGFRRRAKVAMDLFWRPFEVRFSSILERSTQHRELYEAELREVCTEEMLLHYNRVDEAIQQNAVKRSQMEDEIAAREDKALQDEISKIKTWIASPDFQELFDLAVRRRLPNTGQWLLLDPVYSEFVNPRTTQVDETKEEHQVIHIFGKPGYGKTILSTLIIEDLRNRLRHQSSDDKYSRILAFYYFEQRNPNASRSISAFQAILTQVIHACRKDAGVADIASLVMNETGSGQSKASHKDVLTILRVLMKRVQLYLVCDGLDECTDWPQFLEEIGDLTAGTLSKIIFLGRPHAWSVESQARSLHLQSGSNATDIRSFLEPKLAGLLSRGLIAGNLTLNEVLQALVFQAHGMFLWANLMASFLSSPFLTPWERRNAIDNVRLLDGLDAMFRFILEERKRNLPSSQWNKLQLLFKCLTAGVGPWTPETLNTALAIQFDRSFDDTDLIGNFDVSLVQFSSSLVEIQPNNTVEFIHLSIAEFFEASSRAQDGFSIEKDDAHCTLALLCLSYLIFGVPHRPLSGDPNVPADIGQLDLHLPMLRYSTLHWTYHIIECLRYLMQRKERLLFPPDMVLCLSALTNILSKKAPDLLTTWIEASWSFHDAPDLMNLVYHIRSFRGFLEGASHGEPHIFSLMESTDNILGQMTELAVDLTGLNHEWGHVLMSEPNEIWLPSIKAFSKSKFWSETEVQTVQPLTTRDEQGSILISSQVSLDGSKVGVLRVWPPVKAAHRAPMFRVLYKIWDLESLSEICRFWFEVPQVVMPHINTWDRDGDDPTFRFPTALSPSLRQLIILDVVFKIDQDFRNAMEYTCRPQVLPAMGCAYRSKIDHRFWFVPAKSVPESWPSDISPERQGFHTRYKPDYRAGTALGDQCYCFQWYCHHFSLDEKYVVSLEGHNPQTDFDNYRKRVLTIFEINSYDEYVPLASVAVQIFLHRNKEENSLWRFICFHPFRPIVAISTITEVVLWVFNDKGCQKGRPLIQIYHEPLEDIKFSRCGKFLVGKKSAQNSEQSRVVCAVPRCLRAAAPLMPSPSELSSDGSSSQASFHQLSDLNQYNSSNSPVFDLVERKPQMTTLCQSNEDGRIALQTVYDNGMTIKRTLTRIPRLSTLEQSYPTIIESESSEKLRLVLNMATQESYSFISRDADFGLPVVIDRKADTIPAIASGSQAAPPLTLRSNRPYNSLLPSR